MASAKGQHHSQLTSQSVGLGNDLLSGFTSSSGGGTDSYSSQLLQLGSTHPLCSVVGKGVGHLVGHDGSYISVIEVIIAHHDPRLLSIGEPHSGVLGKESNRL